MLPDQNGGTQPQDPVLTTGPLSLETEGQITMMSSSTIDVINRAAKKRRIVWMAIASMATLALFTMVSLIVTRANDTKNTQKTKATAYAATSIPLGDIADKAQVNVGQISQMQVNGTLQVNGSLILPASQVPENAKEGQVYYDKGTGRVYYYNGQEFKAVAAVGDGVTSISGLKGDIVLGQGFNVTNGTINVTPQTAQGTTGVTSFQGQSGSVVLTPGTGIIINGTTIANGGVTSIGGLTGALLPGRGLGVVSGQLTNTVTLTSGSANLTVTDDGNGNYTISQVGVGAGGTVALGPVAPQSDSSNNPSIYVDKTGTGNLLAFSVNGTDEFVVDGTGAITQGSIPYSSVTGRPATTVQSIGGSSGTISLGAGLTMVGNVLSNTGTGISGVNGTVNQVNASTVAGVVTLSLPQNIATTSTPTFASLNLTSPLSAGNGGTGQASVTTGDILVGSAGNSFSKLAVGGLNTCLISNGSTAVWGSCLAGGGGFTSLTLAASGGTPQTITNTGTITIAAGTNINTTAGSTGTVTVSTVSNPSFGGLVTASNGLTISGGNLVVSSGTINTATISGGSLTGGAVSGGSLNTTSVNGVATADIVVTTGLYADPAWITTLAKSKVGLSNVENTALSTWLGSTNISTLGAITTGTWTGSVIGDTYVANNLTIDNSGSVDWVSLNNYPAACAAGSAITALGDTVTCAAFAAGSGSGNYVQIQGVTPGSAQAGNFNIVGTAIAGAFSGNGSAVTNLNASAISSGTVGDTYLSGNVTKLGNNFNGNSQLVQLTAGGLLPILDGSNLTNLNASALASGTIDNNRLSNTVTIQGNNFNGNSQLVQTTAGGAFPALSGVNITSLNGSAINSGTVGVSFGGTGAANASGARTNLGAAASGANSDITSLTGLTAITPSASLTIGSSSQSLTIQGSATTSLRASDSGFTSQLIFAIPTGDAQITIPNTTGTVCLSTGNCLGGGSGGANTSLSNLTSVSLNTSLIPGSNSIDIGSLSAPFKDLYIGNTSGNGVKFSAAPSTNRTITIPDASGTICLTTGNCAGSGGGITGGGTQYSLPVFSNAANIVDSIISQNAGATVVTVTGDISVTGSISGNGSGITSLNADNIASGTLSDSRLSTNVTIQGNQFNGNSQLVKTTAGGALPAISGANLTNLNGSAISSGTVGVGFGGTGQTTLSVGDLLVGAVGNTTSKLAIGANNSCLISNGTNPIWGSCTAGGGGFTSISLAGSTGTPQTITDLGTITIAAGTNISTTAGATGTVTIATVDNPTYSGLVTAGNGLTVSSGNFVVTSGTINNATISGGSLTGGAVSGGSLNGTTVNGVTTADIVLTTGSYADPAWITSIAKSKVGLGNVENTALSTWSGSANLVTLGTITTGTWTGSVITDSYVADNLTISSSGSVDWTALTNYPAGCAAGTAITALGDTVTCSSFAPSTGSGNYVQIQGVTPGVAQNGNFNIDGTAIAGYFTGNGANLSNLSGSNVTSGVVAINVGGTGATTAQNAINNISGLTTNGDLLYSNGTNSTRLPRGNNGECLLSSAATVFWGNCAGSGTTYFNLMGSSGVSQPINGGDTVTVAAGTNITSVAGATDTVTIAVTDTPTFAGLITGQAGLTVSSGGANITGNSNITGTLGSLTGLTSSGTIIFSGLGTNGFVKTTGSNGTLTVSTTVALTSDVSGTLSVSNGGTGGTTFTPNGILYGTGTTALGITGAGVTGDCLVATTSGAPSWQNCAATVGTGGDLQSSYNTSTGGTTPEIKVDATRGAVDIQDANSSINGIIFAVRGSNASGLGTPFLSVSSDGTTTFKSNSNYGFEIQNPSGVGLFLTNNINSTVTIPGYNNLVVLGPELITNSDYSSAAWTSTGSWTLTSTDATHNVGTYDTLDTTQVTPIIGFIYVVHVDFVNNTNNGCLFIAFAGSAGSGNCGTNSYAEVQVKASATSTLSLTASDTFNGKVTNVSIKAYPTSRTPALTVGDTAIQAGAGGSTYIGQDSGSKSFGFYNTGVGAGTLTNQQQGTYNTALGYNALHVSESGYNTAIGSSALLSNTSGSWNTALGYYSLPSNTTGNNNVSIGYSSSAQLVNGTNNTAVGNTALTSTTSGSYNTAIGYGSGSNNKTGNYNLFLGYMTGYLDTSSGFSTPDNLQYATAVGSGAIVQQSYSLVLGQVGTKVGIGTTIPMNQLSVAGWAVASDNNASASQSGTTVTGVGTSWDASMVGMQFVFSNGSNGIITAVTDSTHLTLNTSQTVASTSWRIQKIGFQVTNSGGVFIQTSESNAFKVNTDNGITFFGVDTGAGKVTIGQGGAGNLPGKLSLYNSSNYNDITLVAGATTTSFTLTLPTSAGNANECLKNSGTAGILQFGSCGAAGGDLQAAYNAGSAGDQVVQYSNTNNSVIFRNPASSGTASSFALKVDQLNTGSGADGVVVNNAGTGSTLNLQNNGTSVMKVDNSGNILGVGASTATTGTTEATARTNVTTVTLTAAGSFANNDIIFIDNAGQDYYTRIVSGGGTTTLTVSPAVSYDASATVTKYIVQNIGATTTDYTTQSNRFFQGYFLGGVVTGAGSTTLSDGSLKSSTYLNLQAATGTTVKSLTNNTEAFQVQNASGTNLLALDTTNNLIKAGATTGPVTNNHSINDPYTSTPTGALTGTANYVSGQYVELNNSNSQHGEVEYIPSPAITGDFDTTFDFWDSGGADAVYFYINKTNTPVDETDTSNGYLVSFSEYNSHVRLSYGNTVLATTGLSGFNDANWHSVHITRVGTVIQVYYDGVLKIGYTDTARTYTGTKLGLGARSGGVNGAHRVKSFITSWDTVTPGTSPVLNMNTTTGQTVFLTSTDSTTGFQVQNASGSAVINVDTLNQRLGVNTTNPAAPLEVSVSTASQTFAAGFEGGTLAPFTQTAAYSQWHIDTTPGDAHTGSNSARIDTVGAPASTLSLTKSLTSAGTIDFWLSLSPWIDVTFKIDGATQQSWSNNAMGYTHFSYAVGSGSHTFTWEVSGYSGRYANIDDIGITNTSPSNTVAGFNGAIGVNTNTAASNFLLDVNTGSSANTLWAGVASSQSTNLQGGLLFHQYQSYGFQLASQNTSSSANGQLVFDYRNTSDGTVTKANILTVQSNGNVGIGSASPSNLLSVGLPSGGDYFNGAESGTLGDLTSTGSHPWTVANNNAHSGSFSIVNDQSNPSNLSLTKTLSSSGTISFWFAKNTWMNGSFKIDGVQQVGWGNGGQSYGYYSYSVASGTHTFTWESTASVGNGDAHVDDITITNVAGSSVSAAFDGYVGVGTTTPTARLQVGGSNMTNAFQVQNAAGKNDFTVDSTNGQLIVGDGSASGVTGKLVLQNSGQGSTNAVTITSANQANALTLTIPADANSSDTFCLLTLANCSGGAATLQAAYTGSTGGTTPEILLDSTRGGLDIQDANSSINGSLLTVRSSNGSGLGSAFLDVNSNGLTTIGGNLVANGSATGTTGSTEANARTNVTTITLTVAGSFANNDVIFINNAGQDYYTRIVSGGGTTTLTVSPEVSYDASATVTKYNVQNIGATGTDYTTQANRFFQGYFLGGVVTGAGSTTLSDGSLKSSTGLKLQASTGVVLSSPTDITTALQVQNTNGGSLLSVGTSNNQVTLGASAALTFNDPMTSTPNGTMTNNATYVAGSYVRLTDGGAFSNSGQIAYTDNSTTNYDTNFQYYTTGGTDDVFWFSHASSTPTTPGAASGGYKVSFNQAVPSGSGTVNLYYDSTLVTSATGFSPTSGVWHDVRIVLSGTRIKVYYDSSIILDYTDITRSLTGTKFGLAGYVGGYWTGSARVRSFTMNSNTGAVVGNVGLNVYGTGKIQSSTNSTTAFQVQNANAANILTVNTVDRSFILGASTGTGYTNNSINETYTSTPSGTLSGAATYVSGQYVALVTNCCSTGAIEYNPNIESDFDASFQYNMNGGYTGILLYAFNTSTPGQEGGATGGYQISYNQYDGNIKLIFNGTTLTSVAASYDSNWHDARVVKTGTNIKVYLDAVLKIDYTDSARVLSGTKFGLDGYTNCCGGNKWVRNFSLTWPTVTPGSSPVLNVNTATGQTAFTSSTNSTTAFRIQNASAKNVLTADTTNGKVILGDGAIGGINGALVIQNAGQNSTNAVTIVSANQANAVTLTIPADANASDTFCLLTLANCASGGVSLQVGYNVSTGSTTPEIKLDSTRAGLDIQDANTTINSSLLTVRGSNGSGLGSSLFEVKSNGQVGIGGSPAANVNFEVQGSGDTIIAAQRSGGMFVGLLSGTSGSTFNFNAAGNFYINPASSIDDASIDAQHNVTVTGGGSYSFLGVNNYTPSAIVDINGDGTTLLNLADAGTSVLSIANEGATTFKNKTNSTTAFQIQNSGGTSYFTADSANLRVTVTNLVVTASLTVNGHIISGNSSGTTTVAAGAAACTTPTVSITGNDTAGVITVTTGTGCAAGGTLATVSFANSYASAPPVIITPQDSASAALQTYATQGTGTFVLGTNTTAAATTTYKYNYLVVQ